MRKLVACACFALAANPGIGSAKSVEPAEKWVVDFGESRCVAQRVYGDANNPIYLQVKASPIGEGLQLSAIVRGPNGYGVQENAKLTLGVESPIELSQLRFGANKKQVRMVNLTKAHIDQLSRATELRWSAAHFDYSMRLGSMGNLVRVIEKCRTGLGDYWNGTPEKKALLKQDSTMNTTVRRLFSTNDYPTDAIVKDQSGTAHIVALIDEKGEMADCTVVETSGVAVLDAQTCIMISKRGRFSPAIGADGKPTKSTFSQRVRWEMP